MVDIDTSVLGAYRSKIEGRRVRIPANVKRMIAEEGELPDQIHGIEDDDIGVKAVKLFIEAESARYERERARHTERRLTELRKYRIDSDSLCLDERATGYLGIGNNDDDDNIVYFIGSFLWISLMSKAGYQSLVEQRDEGLNKSLDFLQYIDEERYNLN